MVYFNQWQHATNLMPILLKFNTHAQNDIISATAWMKSISSLLVEKDVDFEAAEEKILL